MITVKNAVFYVGIMFLLMGLYALLTGDIKLQLWWALPTVLSIIMYVIYYIDNNKRPRKYDFKITFISIHVYCFSIGMIIGHFL